MLVVEILLAPKPASCPGVLLALHRPAEIGPETRNMSPTEQLKLFKSAKLIGFEM